MIASEWESARGRLLQETVPVEPVPAEQAYRTLSFRENRRRGLHVPRRGKPPDIEAVTEKIERLARAVKRHREGEP